MGRLSWRAQLELLAESEVSIDDVDVAMAKMAVGMAAECSSPAQARDLLDAWGNFKLRSREASPSDMTGFAELVTAQFEMLNGGVAPKVIAFPKPLVDVDSE